MAMVILRTPRLTREQKLRIGERILQILHDEGVLASQTVVRFDVETEDLYLDGGLLVEAERPEGVAGPVPAMPPVPAVPELPMRRSRSFDRAAYRERLVDLLRRERSVTSYQAQMALGLKDDPRGAAYVRDLFKTLEDEGLLRKEGQRRGTRYFWRGEEDASNLPAPILVKREVALEDDADPSEGEM